MSDPRTTILTRIWQALVDVPESEKTAQPPVERAYLTADSDPDLDRQVARFVERVSEYRAKVHRIGDAADLASEIAKICLMRGVRSLVVPDGVPEAWIPDGVAIFRDRALTHDQLDACDGVLTGCALGIAQTGTIILDRGADQGRRALTLLPDFHLCVIRDDQIVGIVPEAVARIESSASQPGRPLTWISGPSATSDIELNRVEGVHGPRTLEVLVVRSRRNDPSKQGG